jgi:hypothetical protein
MSERQPGFGWMSIGGAAWCLAHGAYRLFHLTTTTMPRAFLVLESPASDAVGTRLLLT